MKLALAVLFLFFGEFLAIWAELFIARSGGIWRDWLIAFVGITVGGLFLLIGYFLGYQLFKSLWLVAVISIASIAIAEPILIYGVYNEVPSWGAMVGLCLAIAAITVAVVW